LKWSKSQAETWDTRIRQGEGREVLRELQQVAPRLIPPQERMLYAQLVRRVGRPDLGLASLSKTVRPYLKSPTDQVALRDLLVEYAICMQRLGGRRQALQLLKRSDLATSPEAQLGQAFVYMSEWDYEAAEQILRAVLSNPEISDYQRQIARLNHFASRVAMESLRDEAEPELLNHLHDFDAELGRSKSIRLQAAVRELEAQLAIARSNWKAALRALDRAQDLLRADPSAGGHLLTKWQMIYQTSQSGNFAELRKYKDRCLERGLWEIARDTDFHLLLFQFDPRRAAYLWAGTPYPHYKRRIEVLLNRQLQSRGGASGTKKVKWTPPESPYEWGYSGPVFQVERGLFRGETLLEPGSRTFALVRTVLTDFYRPQPNLALFGELYPNESFDPISSPLRIRQLLTSARRALKAVPLQLLTTRDGIRIKKETQLILRLDLQPPVQLESLPLRSGSDRSSIRLARLKEKFGEREFSSQEACEVLGLSQPSLFRLMQTGLERSEISARGEGRGRRYRFSIE